jgi:hypothetical protein
MKNLLSLFTVCLLFIGCATTFTACVNGVDDEYLELQNNSNGDSNDKDDGDELPDLSGDYTNGGEYELQMTYNGEELKGRKVTFLTDDKNETATITLAGDEIDLSNTIGGLLTFKVTPYSPIPGEKEMTLKNVKLYGNNGTYKFEGEEIQPTRTITYKGLVTEEKMTIDLTHQLANDELIGTWKLAPARTFSPSKTFSPLWLDMDSEVPVSMDTITLMGRPYGINMPINSAFTLLVGIGGNIVLPPIGPEKTILNLLQSITTQKDGCMYATYSYSGDIQKPEWSSNMSRNILRYYYGETPGKLYVEIDANVIKEALDGLINTTPITRADPGNTIKIGNELIAMLTPILQKGLPLEYQLEDDKLSINIDGIIMRDFLSKLLELANDPYVKELIEQEVGNLLGDFAKNVLAMIRTLPNALTYHDYDKESKSYSGECGYVKFGLHLVKAN